MRVRIACALLPAAALLTACFMDVKTLEHDDDAGSGNAYPHSDPPPVLSIPAKAPINYDDCREARDADHYQLVCSNEGSDRWWTNCSEGSCRQLPVTVHYLVDKNLGTSSQVKVEAFDNPSFHGAPVAVALISGFDTSRVGTFRQDELFVEPGEYFVRAYIVPETGAATPYEYKGMSLVAGSPVGVYGAASGAANAHVSKIDWEAPKPVEISLDRLFEDPSAKPPTEARLRVLLALGDGVTTQGPAKILVDVSTHEDFAFKAEYRFEVSADQLRVVGREGKAELLTPDLAAGTYFLRAFLDESANGFLDAGEPTVQLAASVAVIEKRTADVSLVLAKP